MAVVSDARFDESTVESMRKFYGTLSEKDKRRYAAVEAKRLGYGGIAYIAELLGCSIRTISRGIEELNNFEEDPVAGRIRRPGAGRKKSNARVRSRI